MSTSEKEQCKDGRYPDYTAPRNAPLPFSSKEPEPASITVRAPNAGAERLHALDAVRAGALLLGVVLHATMPFLPGQQVWMVRDEQSTTLGVLFFVPHIFRMSLFFLIAGFFGRMSFHRRGFSGFVRDRLKRIAVPLVVFWPILFASLAAIVVWGVTRQYGPEAAKEIPVPEGSIVETFPLTHLWFLYVLLGFYAAFLAARGLVAPLDRGLRLRRRIDRVVKALVRSGLAPFVLAVPTSVALYLRKDWLMWLGVPSPDHGLIPNAAALAAFGVAFGFGWLLERQMDELRVLERRWLPHLAAALGLSAVCVWIAGVTVTLDPSTQPAAQDPTMRLMLAAGYPLATWAWTFGLIGLAMRFLSGQNAAIRYVADSSYWVYLIHLPIVMVAQVLLFPLPLPALAKFALVLAIAFPVLLFSYQWMVRYSFLGALLNGRRHERGGRRRAVEQALATLPR
ncbi:MAG: acyltransferase family protein [Planctomycetota bacterium]|jgi:peptidoglycan/LPS O-acetylase OafA/YrhL